MDAIITSSYYETIGNELYLRFFGRNEDGTRMRKTCRAPSPYFYIETEEFHEKLDVISCEPTITGFKHDGINLYNKPLTRLETQFPYEVGQVREKFGFTYEADVPFTKRFRYDHGIKYAINYPEDKKILDPSDLTPIHEIAITPHHLSIDIEVDDRFGFVKPDQASADILTFGFYDPTTNTYHCIINAKGREMAIDKKKVIAHMKELYQRIPEETRKKLGAMELSGKLKITVAKNEVEAFVHYDKYVKERQPDIMMGWNNVYYDMPYIETRAKNNGFIMPNHKALAWFDAMEGYDTLHENALPSKKLEDCAQETLGYGKMPRENIYEMWENDPEKLIAYNLWDCRLVEFINQIRTILPYFIKIIELSGCEFEDVQYSSRIVDSYIFFLLQGKVRLPSLYKINKRKIEGAYVKDPAKGIHHMCGVLDLKSQYPMAILSLNASPETALYTDDVIERDGRFYAMNDGEEVLVNKSPLPGLYFIAEPQALLPMCIVRLVDERDEMKRDIKALADQGYAKDSPEIKAKNEMQRALKYLTNSFYGVITSSYYRLANDDVGETITTISKRIITESIEMVEEKGYPVIYSDTDSLVVEFGEVTIEQALEYGNGLAVIINQNFINVMADFTSNPEGLTFKIKFETIYEVYFQTRREEIRKGEVVFVGKKRYIGLIGWDENHGDMTDLPVDKRMKIRGFEVRRRNVSKTTYNIQMDLFHLIVTTKGEDIDSKILDLYKERKRKFVKGEFGRDIFVRAILSKAINEYGGKGDTSYVTAFKVANKAFKQDLEIGDTFYWSYIKVGSLIMDDGSMPNAIGLNFDKTNWKIEGKEVTVEAYGQVHTVELDMEKMFRRNIIKPTSTILEHGLDINIEKLVMKMDGQTTLPFF